MNGGASGDLEDDCGSGALRRSGSRRVGTLSCCASPGQTPRYCWMIAGSARSWVELPFHTTWPFSIT
jgi:hypothetical protein